MEAVLLSFATFFSTILGGLFGMKNRQHLHYIMAFAAGVLIAVCFFDILPEAFNLINENKLDTAPLFIAVVVGFLVFHTIEKTIVIHHAHESEYADHKHPDVGLAGALGLSLHSFLDGVGIGIGFSVSSRVGLLIAAAVIAHDFSDGLNTITYMLANKNSIKKALVLLLVDAAAPIAGVFSTRFFHMPPNFLVLYLGFFAGFLLYIGASDLLPEAHSKHGSFKMIGLTILAVIFIFAVTRMV